MTDEGDGFFTRDKLWKMMPKKHLPRRKTPLLPGLINPSAKTQNMLPTIVENPILYVLGEAPGENEDESGEPFVGKAGQTLRNALGDAVECTCFDNTVRVRPPENRKPKPEEIELFRPAVARSIYEAAPRVLLAVGAVPARWALGDVMPKGKEIMGTIRGRRLPYHFPDRSCWLHITYHPSYINHMAGGPLGDELRRFFIKDIEEAVKESLEGPPPSPPIEIEKIETESCMGEEGQRKFIKFIESLIGTKQPVAIDFETTALRPYGESARILSLAVATADRCIACEWPKDNGRFAEVVGEFFADPVPKIAHGLPMELEWALDFCGYDILQNAVWHDTQAQAYVLGNRRGVQSLNWLCYERFGIHLKSQSLGEVDKNNMAALPVPKLLRYNALDAYFTFKLYRVQRKMLEAQGLTNVYFDQVLRIPPMVVAQYKGAYVDQGEVKSLQTEFSEKVQDVQVRMDADPAVVQYTQKYGALNYNSPKQLMKLFDEFLKMPTGTTDESFLSEIKDLCPFAAHLLAHRTLAKMKSTFIDPMDAADKDTLIYPDGKVHPHINSTFTDTRRTSSNDPNMQNFPTREYPQIRKMFVAPNGYLLLKNDYSAMEACGIAMTSKDANLVKFIIEQQDIHLQWAQKLAELYPQSCKTICGGVTDKIIGGEYRSVVKNRFVFPSFFGAGAKSISVNLGIPEDKLRTLYNEFWRFFRGVKQWQTETNKQYLKRGYVELLTGFRRYGPLSFNEQVNTPVQGTCCDIIVDAWIRLLGIAVADDAMNMAPVWMIHDDLTFLVPERDLDHYHDVTVQEMLKPVFPFINVPLAVESSVGKSWDRMEKIGKHYSTQWI
jgi:uracil-DNA glycosylase family 4